MISLALLTQVLILVLLIWALVVSFINRTAEVGGTIQLVIFIFVTLLMLGAS